MHKHAAEAKAARAPDTARRVREARPQDHEGSKGQDRAEEVAKDKGCSEAQAGAQNPQPSQDELDKRVYQRLVAYLAKNIINLDLGEDIGTARYHADRIFDMLRRRNR